MMNVMWHRIFFSRYMFLYLFIVLLFHPDTIHSQDNGSALKTVVIDPGHGGRDPGAVGARSKEKDIVLDVSLRLGKMISDNYPDVEVIYTRKTDVLIEHHRRADIANNAKANLFISIHTNAAEGRCPSGTETFVMGNTHIAANMEVAKRENSVILFEDDHSTRYANFDPNRPESYIIFDIYQNAYFEQSVNFAGEIQNQFKNFAKRVDRSVKQGPFIVLWRTAMPSVLVELGFICNAEEERYMNSEAGKQQLATAIFRAFSSYKSKIEERNGFHTTSQIPEVEQSNPIASNEVEFCIQILSASRVLNSNSSEFKSYTNVERFQASPNMYRYIVGRTTDYAAAQENLKKVRSDFADAFIVCIVDGKIVPLAEGLKLIIE